MTESFVYNVLEELWRVAGKTEEQFNVWVAEYVIFVPPFEESVKKMNDFVNDCEHPQYKRVNDNPMCLVCGGLVSQELINDRVWTTSFDQESYIWIGRPDESDEVVSEGKSIDPSHIEYEHVEIRKFALEKSLEYASRSETTQTIVTRAKGFENYLLTGSDS